MADRSQLNTSINLDIFDGSTFVSSMYANGIRSDVGSYLHDNGYHGFSYPIPAGVKDGKQHTLWARVSNTNTDLINVQTLACTVSNSQANVSLSPSYVVLSQASGCYEFTFAGTEKNGVGTSLSNLAVSPDGLNYPLPTLGIPGRLEAYGTFSAPLQWCRAPGISTFDVTGSDDHGNSHVWSTTITFALQ